MQVSAPALLLGLQGALNTVVGIYGVVRPSDFFVTKMADQLGGSMPRLSTYASSLQLLGVGLFTLSAATQPGTFRQALTIRIFLHLAGGYLFWREHVGFTNVALVEFGFVLLNVLGLAFIKKHEDPRNTGSTT